MFGRNWPCGKLPRTEAFYNSRQFPEVFFRGWFGVFARSGDRAAGWLWQLIEHLRRGSSYFLVGTNLNRIGQCETCVVDFTHLAVYKAYR